MDYKEYNKLKIISDTLGVELFGLASIYNKHFENCQYRVEKSFNQNEVEISKNGLALCIIGANYSGATYIVIGRIITDDIKLNNLSYHREDVKHFLMEKYDLYKYFTK